MVAEERTEGFMRVPYTAHGARRKDQSMCNGTRVGITCIIYMFFPSHMEIHYI